MKYIENLADNYPNKNSSTKQMDLVLEGGVFNGSYQLGGLLLLKEFEKRKYIKIKRISEQVLVLLWDLLFLEIN